jgi:tellurite resistance protein TehA-like permease
VDQQHIYISDTKTKLQFYLGWFGFTFPAALYGYVFFSTINSTEQNQGENS